MPIENNIVNGMLILQIVVPIIGDGVCFFLSISHYCCTIVIIKFVNKK